MKIHKTQKVSIPWSDLHLIAKLSYKKVLVLQKLKLKTACICETPVSLS